MMRKHMVVAMEQFTHEYWQDEILLRVSGGGIPEKRMDDLYCDLTDIDGIKGAIITRWCVSVEKKSEAEWLSIISVVKGVLVKHFGKGVRIIERTRGKMPEQYDMMLGRAEMDLIREVMQDCALTEEEREVLGI